MVLFKGIKIAKESLQVHQKAYGWLMNQGFLVFEASEYATKMAGNFDEKFIKMLIEKIIRYYHIDSIVLLVITVIL